MPDTRNVANISRLCLFAVILGFGAASAQVRPVFSRTIRGVVLDKENQPVSDARVCAWGTAPMGGVVPCGQSNLKGQFAFDVHRGDTYTITASALAEGYPEASWGFYGKIFSNFPVVTVDETGDVAPVEIKLGPKAGRLILRIVDEDTNEPITKGSIRVCRVGEPLSYWSMSTAFPNGRFELLTPEVPFTISFQTWEQNDWVTRSAFDDSSVPIEMLQVDLGAQKEITVRLK
jgi:hypothetical protein